MLMLPMFTNGCALINRFHQAYGGIKNKNRPETTGSCKLKKKQTQTKFLPVETVTAQMRITI